MKVEKLKVPKPDDDRRDEAGCILWCMWGSTGLHCSYLHIDYTSSSGGDEHDITAACNLGSAGFGH